MFKSIWKLFLVCAAMVGGVLLYCKRHSHYDDKLNDEAFQRIKNLTLTDILEWAQRNLSSSFTKGTIRILPPGKSVDLLSDATLSASNKQKCVYFDVVDDKDNVFVRKIALPLSIADDLSPIKEGKVYEIPLEA